MRSGASLLMLVPLAAAAANQGVSPPPQVAPQIIGPSDVRAVVAPPIIGPSDIRVRLVTLCLGRIPDGVGTGDTQHELGADVIGEKVIGGKSGADRSSVSFGDRWLPGSERSFRHDLAVPQGDYRIDLYGCSSSLAGETVTVRVLDQSDVPLVGWTERVIALPAGASRGSIITLPKGAATARLRLLISVGTPPNPGTSGYYLLTVTRAPPPPAK